MRVPYTVHACKPLWTPPPHRRPSCRLGGGYICVELLEAVGRKERKEERIKKKEILKIDEEGG